MHEMQDTQNGVLHFMERIPTQFYLAAMGGSILLSAFFFLTGRRSTSMFVGQWVPSLGMFALVYKLLRPSYERPMDEAMGRAQEMTSSIGR